MLWTVERLRVAIVAVAVFLLLAILGFSLYARWRVRRLAQDLPARLGLQIQQSTQGFVLSKTEQGRTIFTLHASRAVAFKSGGRVLLHDVEIDVYNQDGQADKISGKDFQYDRNSQIVESQGEAHILLHPPGGASASSMNKETPPAIRVTTHGLVFNQKTGVATCRGEVDFQVADAQGQAVGAEYDSKPGHLLLQSQVMLTAAMQTHPVIVHAKQAVYDRNRNLVHLLQPQYDSATPQGNQQGSSGTAVVLLRPDGSAERLDAQGGVHLTSAGGDSVKASSLHAALNGSSRPQHIHFIGNVQFSQKLPDQQSAASAGEALVDLDLEGRARRAVFEHDVRFHQQLDASRTAMRRTLHSQHLDLHLASGKSGQSELQTAEADGDAVFRSQSSNPGKAPQQTRISGQTLKAHFIQGNQMDHMDGIGQTEIRTVALNGDVDSSRGDSLTIDFAVSSAGRSMPQSSAQMTAITAVPADRRGKASPKGAAASPAQSIRYAVQTGHVVLQQTSKAKTGSYAAPQVSTATAARAEYHSSNDTLELTGQPVFRNAQMELAANAMQVQRATEQVTATGAVQGTLWPRTRSPHLLQGGSGSGLLGGGREPAHIVARQAMLLHDSQKATFSGSARLWQGNNTVEAPVIEVSQKSQTLLAYADGPCMQCVHSVFAGQSGRPERVSSARPIVPAAQRPGSPGSGPLSPFNSPGPQIFRILSQRLLYSDAERKATLTDRVEVIHAGDELFADHAEIYLSPGPPAGADAKSLAPASQSAQTSVQRIVATGDVRLIQPGRRATGARLVYTAADGRFVLRGDGKLPQVVDAVRGTVSGPVLTFSSQEQAIIVGGTSTQPTTTATRVRKK